VTKTLGDFEQIIFADFEFVAKPGERPDVVCLAWHEWPSGQTHCLWHDQLGDNPPYRIDDKVLFACFVANAELDCHLSRHWPLPANVIDLSAEFRCITNGRVVPQGKGLLGALAYFGIDNIGSKRKDAMRARIMKGWPFTPEERAEILLYVASDAEPLARLLMKMLPHINLDIALHRGEFVACLARMEHRGVPIDMEFFRQLANKRTWNAIRDAMVPAIDAAYGVYVKDADGEWHFNLERFEAYLEREGITWSRTEKGMLNTRDKTFEAMCKCHPQLENLRQLRYVRNKMRKVKFTVGADGRNRTVLWPFKSKSSRTQPKASQWIFSPAVFWRSLIKPPLGRAVAYVDFSSAEFMIAASLSNDPVMLEFYRNGDPYLSFAKRVGAAPPDATKKTHGSLRDRYKTGLLSIQYGIKSEALAERLDISTFAAHEMIGQHHELFSVYWRWVDDWLAQVLASGAMWTSFGWECRTGITEFNERSITNFPVQATCADILRIACIMVTRRGLELLAPVHDALLIEAPIDRIEADVALLREIMRWASRIVLNPTADGPHELRTDATIVRYPDRYCDGRGAEIWAHVLNLLTEHRRQQADAAMRAG
jgi:DNA polymerase I